MLEISENLVSYLNSQTAFSTVMEGKLFPVVATEDTKHPFTTYKITEQIPQSKDGTSANVEIYFWFGPSEYKKCVEFLDAMKPIIEQNNNYEWRSSTVDFIEAGYSFAGIINLTVN